MLPPRSIGCSHDTLERLRVKCALWGKTIRCLFYLPTCPRSLAELQRWHSKSMLDSPYMWVHVKDVRAVHAHRVQSMPSIVRFDPGREAIAEDIDPSDDIDQSEEAAPPIIKPVFLNAKGDVATLVKSHKRCVVLQAGEEGYSAVREQWNDAMLCDTGRTCTWCVLRGSGNARIWLVTQEGAKKYNGALRAGDICQWLGLDPPSVYSTFVPPGADVQRAIMSASSHVPVMVLYYADWCAHCQSFKKDWNETVRSTVDMSDTQWIALNESSPQTREMIARDKVRGFPTVMKHLRGVAVDMANKMSTRDAESLRQFARP